MGWVEQRGKRWRACWRVSGQRVSVSCATKAEALTLLAQMEADRSRGVYAHPRAGEVTVKDWAAIWVETRPHLKASSDATDRGRLERHIVGRLGTMQLNDVSPLVVRKWVSDLLKSGLAPKTVRNCHGLLHTLMQGATDERLIPANPCVSTKLPEVGHREMHFLTSVEVDRLVAATQEHYQPLIRTLAMTGLRWGEVAGLRRKRVDLLAGKLEVAETLHEVNGKVTFGTPKSRSARRVVSLSPGLVDVLVPFAVGEPDEPFFTTARGEVLRRHNFSRRVWHPAVKEAGLPEDLRVHDLRHTHAAHLISGNYPLTAVQRRLGHASIRITSDVYGHLLPEVDTAMMSALDEAFAPKLPPVGADLEDI